MEARHGTTAFSRQFRQHSTDPVPGRLSLGGEVGPLSIADSLKTAAASLRTESLDLPNLTLSYIHKSVVEPLSPALPKLYSTRNDTPHAPGTWHGDVIYVLEPLLCLGSTSIQLGSPIIFWHLPVRLQYRALRTGP